MKSLLSILSLLMVFLLSSCSVVGDIFKAGVWVGVLVVLGVIGLIIFLVTRRSK